MQKGTLAVVILVLAVLCLLTVICAGTGYLLLAPAPERPAEARDPVDATPTAPIDGEQPSPEPSEPGHGTLRVMGGLPPTLDPHLVQDSTSAEYVVHLFSGLVSLNAALEVVPDLAHRWDLDPSGTRYTFHLVPEATFADGKPIDAQQIIASIERACSPALSSPVAVSYLGDIVGVEAYARGEAETIAGLEALDAHTLAVTIDAPKAYFLAKLTYPTAFVVDVEQIAATGERWMLEPNVSGPFSLESVSRERIVLARNPHYHGRLPYIARAEFLIGGGLPMTMYENDLLDIVDVSPGEIERVLDPENPLYDEHRVESELSVQYLGLNVEMPPFDDPVVRQAFAHAIDRQRIAELVLRGTASPAEGVLPPAMPDYNPDLRGLAYDPERARELLRASRYAQNMPEIVLAVSGTSGHMPPLADALWHMIAENLGIEMVVEQIDWADFLGDMNERRLQAFTAGWIADYPDSQNFIDLLFHSQSAQNHTGYRNPEVDALLEQARIEADADARTALYRRAEEIIVADAAWVPLTHGIAHTLVKPYVEGYTARGAIYPWLGDIRLAR